MSGLMNDGDGVKVSVAGLMASLPVVVMSSTNVSLSI